MNATLSSTASTYRFGTNCASVKTCKTEHFFFILPSSCEQSLYIKLGENLLRVCALSSDWQEAAALLSALVSRRCFRCAASPLCCHGYRGKAAQHVRAAAAGVDLLQERLGDRQVGRETDR